MADTLEYSNVAFPRDRFEDELVAELKHFCPSVLEEDGDTLVIRHVYIERRMIPLNIYLQDATREQIEAAVIEYGNAIKDLVRANIFPGDMLWKNFGVTRHGKVVFYDYDEIEYLTDCNFRKVPEARNEEEEMSGEVWYARRPEGRLPGDLRARSCSATRPCARSSWRTTPTCSTPPSGKATRSASSPATCMMSSPTKQRKRFDQPARRPGGRRSRSQ